MKLISFIILVLISYGFAFGIQENEMVIISIMFVLSILLLNQLYTRFGLISPGK